jgi:hypothetical protein
VIHVKPKHARVVSDDTPPTHQPRDGGQAREAGGTLQELVNAAVRDSPEQDLGGRRGNAREAGETLHDLIRSSEVCQGVEWEDTGGQTTPVPRGGLMQARYSHEAASSATVVGAQIGVLTDSSEFSSISPRWRAAADDGP